MDRNTTSEWIGDGRLVVCLTAVAAGTAATQNAEMATPGTQLTKATQNSNLDILRSLAVLAVFLCHLLQVLAGCKAGDHFAYGVNTVALGQAGVVIFFVHTSLVLLQSLERTRTRLSGLPLALYFYTRRLFRIYPLSICVILAAVAFSIPPNPLGSTYHWGGTRWFWANILLIQNLHKTDPISSPLWSLPYEVQMYLVLPIIFLQMRLRKPGVRLTGIYVLSLVSSRLFPLLRFAPCFLGGAIAYRLLGVARPRLHRWLWCPAVLGVVVMYVTRPDSTMSWGKDILASLAIGCLIPWFQENRGVSGAISAQLAKYSYGIYLCHLPVLWLAYRKLAIPGWQRPIWLASLMVAAPLLCYHLVEHPLIQVGTRLANTFPARLPGWHGFSRTVADRKMVASPFG